MSHETGLAPLNAPPPPAHLTRKQKAAIIVRFLLNEGAELSLSDLPDELQAQLTQMMGDMRYVDRQTLGSVVMEFASELESIGLSFPRGLNGALSALEGRISPLTAERLRKEAGVRQAGDPWDRLRALPLHYLTRIIDRESAEVSAVLMSKLDVAKAAALLEDLPGEQARRIAYAISLTGGISPAAVDQIGLCLATELDDQPERAFSHAPESRVGEILNHSAASLREEVLNGLEQTDEGFASAVRKAIFTFADIPQRLAPRDVPAALRQVAQEDLVIAFLGAGEEDAKQTTEFLLANISTRLADQIREDMEDHGQVTARDGEAAQTRIVAAIRALADSGDIQLRPATTDEDAAMG